MKTGNKSENQGQLAAGIDAGSTTTKAVVLNQKGEILGFSILPTGADSRRSSHQALLNALKGSGRDEDALGYVVGTGYGREIAGDACETVTEITCHARGVHTALKEVGTIIDIGGQDSKAIRINSHGRVQDFAMNDKCAAGTGRFLEVMSRTLGVPLNRMGEVALMSTKTVQVSSMCTVFAESEVVSLVAKGENVEDILNGIHRAIADRVASLAVRVGIESPAAVTGGVANNGGVVKALEKRLSTPLLIPEEPQITGALGAAIIARDRMEQAG